MLPAFDDVARLKALRGYELLDTPAEETLDLLGRLASELFSTPIALVSLVDEHRQWFKVKVGLDLPETPRSVAFCDHAIRQAGPMMVTDASADPRFANNPLVTGDPKIRFYCGVPLRSPEGHGLGTLCIIDRVPRTLQPAEVESLQGLAKVVETVIELRRRVRLVEQALESSTEVRQGRDLLATMMVHDLRSPLSAIGALCSVLASDHPQTKELVDEILAASTKMSHMLSDMLDLSLGELGKLTLRPSTIEVGEMLRDSGRAWRRLAESRSQRLLLDLPGAPLELIADRELLERVFNNLVDNAVQYGRPGQTVLVRAVQASAQVRFEVVDQGPPIPGKWTTAIFEPFRRLDRSGGPRGRGLGLAFCSAAVRAHGGEIGVAARPEGNCFFFQLARTIGGIAAASGGT